MDYCETTAKTTYASMLGADYTSYPAHMAKLANDHLNTDRYLHKVGHRNVGNPPVRQSAIGHYHSNHLRSFLRSIAVFFQTRLPILQDVTYVIHPVAFAFPSTMVSIWHLCFAFRTSTDHGDSCFVKSGDGERDITWSAVASLTTMISKSSSTTKG